MQRHKPVEGIIGPGISPNDLELALPDCVHLVTERDQTQFKVFCDTIVRAANRNSARVLRTMLARTDGATKLADDFSARLGIQ